MSWREDTGSTTEHDAADWAHAHAEDDHTDQPHPADCITRPHTPFRGYDALVADLEQAVAEGLAELARRNTA